MQVSVEVLNGLGRKLTVSLPTDEFEEKVNQWLANAARKANLPGFRPGKAPKKLIQERFSHEARSEVANEMIQSTIFDAIQQKNLNSVGMPNVTEVNLDEGKDFSYSAVFEIFPEISIKELDKEKDQIEQVDASIKEADLDNTILKLREQNKKWVEVSRAAANDDKVLINFEGFIDDKPFAGGSADGQEIVLGSGSMIPGFEEGIIGKKKDSPFEVNLNFPAEYGHQEVAGKAATFKITIVKIMEGSLPELNDDFASIFNIKEGGIEILKKDIKDNMQRELMRRLTAINKENIFNKIMELNTFELPTALIDKEIEHLKHEMYHQIFGHEHHENEKIPDFPRALFEAKAKRRVHLGLLLSEYAKKHHIKPSKEQVDAKIDQITEAYESPEELRQWYRKDKAHLQEIEALVLEDLLAEKIAESAKLTAVKKTYDEVMNPKPEPKEASEKKIKETKAAKAPKEPKAAKEKEVAKGEQE